MTVPAWCGPPYVTDDPDPTHWGQWEFNLSYQLERDAGGRVMDIPVFNGSYGLLSALELNITLPVLDWDPTGGLRAKGLGDIDLGMKWKFCSAKGRRPELAIAPDFLLPTGNSKTGLGEGSPVYALPVLALTSWGDWTAFGNLGYVVQTAADSRNYLYYGAVLTRELSRSLEIGGEIFGNSPTRPGGSSDMDFNFGSTWTITPRAAVMASVGRSFRPAGPDLYIYAGFQLTLGKSKQAGAKPHGAGHHP